MDSLIKQVLEKHKIVRYLDTFEKVLLSYKKLLQSENGFQAFNDKGLYPELNPFGTGKETGQPHYEFSLYIKGVDRSIYLRRGAPSKGETRIIALQRIAELTEIVLTFGQDISERMFWEGFDYFEHHDNEKQNNPLFKAGKDLRKKVKEASEIWFRN